VSGTHDVRTRLSGPPRDVRRFSSERRRAGHVDDRGTSLDLFENAPFVQLNAVVPGETADRFRRRGVDEVAVADLNGDTDQYLIAHLNGHVNDQFP